jgi:hypothetical protein
MHGHTRTTGGSGNRPIDPADPDDRALLEEAVAAIDEEVDRHFGFEEAVLFAVAREPRRRRHDPVAHRGTRRHHSLGQRPQRGCREGPGAWFRWFRLERFCEIAQELVDRVTSHLQKEEMAILRKLHLFFASATARRLASQYAEHQTG